jgi:hypothetical protein
MSRFLFAPRKSRGATVSYNVPPSMVHSLNNHNNGNVINGNNTLKSPTVPAATPLIGNGSSPVVGASPSPLLAPRAIAYKRPSHSSASVSPMPPPVRTFSSANNTLAP